jgi:hypothetical protein
MKDIPTYINEHEVARITGRALSTLRNERFNRRGIPYYKVGRSVRYSLENVIDFMEARRVQTGDGLNGKSGQDENVA